MRFSLSKTLFFTCTDFDVRGKSTFTGALTNGAFWRFFTAYNKDSHVKIYASAEYTGDTDNGIIIELLKDMVRTWPIVHYVHQSDVLQILYPKSPMVTTDFDKEHIDYDSE